MIIRIDKRLLVDSFVYREFKDLDRNRQPEYAAPVTVKHVRIDRSTVFSRNANEERIVAEAIVFCYAEHTAPFKKFKEKSIIEFDGKEHVLQKVVPVTNPYNNQPFAYELEVI